MTGKLIVAQFVVSLFTVELPVEGSFDVALGVVLPPCFPLTHYLHLLVTRFQLAVHVQSAFPTHKETTRASSFQCHTHVVASTLCEHDRVEHVIC